MDFVKQEHNNIKSLNDLIQGLIIQVNKLMKPHILLKKIQNVIAYVCERQKRVLKISFVVQLVNWTTNLYENSAHYDKNNCYRGM